MRKVSLANNLEAKLWGSKRIESDHDTKTVSPNLRGLCKHYKVTCLGRLLTKFF